MTVVDLRATLDFLNPEQIKEFFTTLNDKGDPPLVACARLNRLDLVTEMLKRGADPSESKPTTGATALLIACQDGFLELARAFLDHGASVNHQCKDDGSTALILAAQDGYIGCVTELLKRGANPNIAATDDGATALILSSQNGYLQTVEILIKHNACVNALCSDDGCSALIYAARNGYVDIVRQLLRQGARVDQLSAKRWTPLTLAALAGQTECAKLLAIYGATLTLAGPTRPRDITSVGETAKYIATRRQHTEFIQWLKQVDGFSPIEIAIASKLIDDAAYALRLGIIDPVGCTFSELQTIIFHSSSVSNASSNSLIDNSSINKTAVTPAQLLAFAKNVAASWGPSRHNLYPHSFRVAINNLLLVRERLGQQAMSIVLPVLPHEMWLKIGSYFSRSWWNPNHNTPKNEIPPVPEPSPPL